MSCEYSRNLPKIRRDNQQRKMSLEPSGRIVFHSALLMVTHLSSLNVYETSQDLLIYFCDILDEWL